MFEENKNTFKDFYKQEPLLFLPLIARSILEKVASMNCSGVTWISQLDLILSLSNASSKTTGEVTVPLLPLSKGTVKIARFNLIYFHRNSKLLNFRRKRFVILFYCKTND